MESTDLQESHPSDQKKKPRILPELKSKVDRDNLGEVDQAQPLQKVSLYLRDIPELEN